MNPFFPWKGPTHLIGPSFAYSSWILLSDIISLLVLRFLLKEHVSLKLNTQQNVTTRSLTWHPPRTPPSAVRRWRDDRVCNDMMCPVTNIITQWGYKLRNNHLLAAKEEEVQPQPGEHQHDDGDGEAEDEPRAEIDHLRIWITSRKQRNRACRVITLQHIFNTAREDFSRNWGWWDMWYQTWERAAVYSNLKNNTHLEHCQHLGSCYS